ncbi:hypothetical protein GWI33_012832, partial [Rhynchophorus ferrugineus]
TEPTSVPQNDGPISRPTGTSSKIIKEKCKRDPKPGDRDEDSRNLIWSSGEVRGFRPAQDL